MGINLDGELWAWILFFVGAGIAATFIFLYPKK
jgi:hypothetical protein